ncbi:GNAT family N-acetyltransferase [Sphingobacterium hungaricum]|nr:GNAT family N-acetyltransferase [Sphingobacterium hungaricum]
MKIEALNKSHDKKDFCCGKSLLDNYIRSQASQDVKRQLSTCTVLLDENRVVGYFTLSSSSIEKDSLPTNLSKNFPPAYTELPCILLGRLAIDKAYRGKGLGGMLLVYALKKSLEISSQIGVLCVIVDPIDEEAEHFYRAYGFILLPTSGKMMISIKTIEGL